MEEKLKTCTTCCHNGLGETRCIHCFAFNKWQDIETYNKDKKEFINKIPLSKDLQFYKRLLNMIYGVEGRKMIIKDVIFNEPATIVLWNDGTKTVVKAQDDEPFDPEKGLAMAISKKALGNTGRYYETFKKLVPEEAIK